MTHGGLGPVVERNSASKSVGCRVPVGSVLMALDYLPAIRLRPPGPGATVTDSGRSLASAAPAPGPRPPPASHIPREHPPNTSIRLQPIDKWSVFSDIIDY